MQQTLHDVASEVRGRLELHASATGKFCSSLRWMCAIASGELWKELKSAGIDATINISLDELGWPSHCFVAAEGFVIDTTATQFTKFKYPKVVVLPMNEIDTAKHTIWKTACTYGTLEEFQTALLPWDACQIAR